MAYNSISIKPNIKSHLKLQREITLIELAPSPYLSVKGICLAYMNTFARFDENPAMTLQDIKEKNVTDGRPDNVKTVYPPQTNKFSTNYIPPTSSGDKNTILYKISTEHISLSVLIWIQTIWHSDSVPETIFEKVNLEKSADYNKTLKNYPACVKL